MAQSRERTLLITLRVRVDPEVRAAPVITAQRHELTGDLDAVQRSVTNSPEHVLGTVRDWLIEFGVTPD